MKPVFARFAGALSEVALGRTNASQGLVALCCVLGASCFLAERAKADFITPYGLGDFTLTNSNANGSVMTPDGGMSIILDGGDNGTGEFGTTDFVTTAQAAGTVVFQWSYFSTDLPGDDFAGFLVNNVYTQLSGNSGDNGSISFSVTQGESFGFEMQTLTNTGGPGILTVSDFSAPLPSSVPEPGTAGMLLLSSLAVAGLVAGRALKTRKARQ